MEHTKAFTLRRSEKPTFFDCHRRFLVKSHAFRKNTTKFKKGLMDLDPPPPRRSGEDIWRRVRDYPKIIDLHTITRDKPEGYGVTHNWDRRSIFWDLPYWKTLLLRHNIDVMHTERNVFMNIFNTVMDVIGKINDTVKGRYHMTDLCSHPELEITYNEKGNLVNPKAFYVLSKVPHHNAICQWINDLKLHDGC